LFDSFFNASSKCFVISKDVFFKVLSFRRKRPKCDTNVIQWENGWGGLTRIFSLVRTLEIRENSTNIRFNPPNPPNPPHPFSHRITLVSPISETGHEFYEFSRTRDTLFVKIRKIRVLKHKTLIINKITQYGSYQRSKCNAFTSPIITVAAQKFGIFWLGSNG
jgi:hypothetical protein